MSDYTKRPKWALDNLNTDSSSYILLAGRLGLSLLSRLSLGSFPKWGDPNIDLNML